MLGRQLTAAFRRPLQARLRTAFTVQPQHNLCIRTFSHAPRQLESAGRPKKDAVEASKPAKRAVKTAAKKPASTKTTAAAKKKAAEKKAATKKKAAEKKVAERKKTAEKKKAAAEKAKAKRVLTPEQVEKKKAALQKAEVKDLKKAALGPPKISVANGFAHFYKEQHKETYDAIKEQHPNVAATELTGMVSRENAAKWKTLSASEIEHYRQLGQTVKEASRAEYKSWVESHSVEEIAIANAARKSLRRRQPSAKGHISKWPEIVDERLVKRNVNPYTLYFVNRQASGEFGDAPITERAKIIAKDWHALDASEKQKYIDLAKQDAERYESEYQSVFGHAPVRRRRSASPTPSAA